MNIVIYSLPITYRSVLPVIGAATAGTVIFVVGLAGMIVGSWSDGGAEIGALVVALIVALWLSLIQSRAVAASDGLTYWYNFRRHSIPWSDIRGFSVGRAAGSSWSSLVVTTTAQRRRIKCIVGTRRWVDGIVAELTAVQRQVTGTAPAGPDPALPRSPGPPLTWTEG